MSGRVRFQADEDLETQIIKGLRRRQPLLEIETIPSAGLRGKPDSAILAFCAEQERVLVSHDLKTMPTQLAAFLADGQHSSGLILIPRTVSIAQAINDLYLIWEVTPPEYWRDRFIYFSANHPLTQQHLAL